MQVIIYPTNTTIAVVYPTPETLQNMSIQDIAFISVPQGLPFRIIDGNLIPSDRTFRDAWEADFTNPDGFGGRV